MKTFILLLGLLLPASGFAQGYSVSWSRIAGGGGRSSGGSFALVGTIGQADAGRMTGGTYRLEGGFLSGLVLIQTPGTPALSIQLSGANAVVSWSANAASGFNLQEADTLSAESWKNSAAAATTNNGIKSVTVPATGIKYYRLHQP